MASKNTVIGRVPKEVLEKLRFKFPNVRDADLWRLTYNLSAVKAEITLYDKDFKNKLGRFL